MSINFEITKQVVNIWIPKRTHHIGNHHHVDQSDHFTLYEETRKLPLGRRSTSYRKSNVVRLENLVLELTEQDRETTKKKFGAAKAFSIISGSWTREGVYPRIEMGKLAEMWA